MTAPAVKAREKGKITVMFGCRGGAGATTLAVNVGASLARAGKSVCILDMDLQLGDVFVALDLEANTSVAALAREAATIDGPALRRRLQRHDSGLYALSQTGRLEDVDPQLPERMPSLLTTLRNHFEVVIVDGVRDFDDYALAALDLADQIAMVLTQDVAAIRRASRVTRIFRQLGYSDRKLQLVLNRFTVKAPIREDEVERALGAPITARVRNDYRRMTDALNDGAVLCDVARGAGVANDVDDLAKLLLGRELVTAPTAPKPGLLTGLFAGWKWGGKAK